MKGLYWIACLVVAGWWALSGGPLITSFWIMVGGLFLYGMLFKRQKYSGKFSRNLTPPATPDAVIQDRVRSMHQEINR